MSGRQLDSAQLELRGADCRLEMRQSGRIGCRLGGDDDLLDVDGH
jgi:hypothetical protein